MSNRVVGDVAVRVGADVGPLGIGLRKAGSDVDRWGKSTTQRAAMVVRKMRNVGVAVAAMGAAFAAAGLQAISALDKIGKTSAKIGATAEELQRLRFAAESAGVANESLESSLERFTKRLGEAEQGFGAAKKQLEFLNLSAEELIALPMEERLGVVADKLQDIPDAATRAAVAAGLFGREGVGMVNMLKDGSEALQATTDAASDFGAVVSNEVVAEAEALEDRMGRLGAGIKGQLNEALVEAGPLLILLAENALKLARSFNALVTVVGDVWSAMDELLFPQGKLLRSQDELVRSMGDEIVQAQLLNKVLERGGTVSAATARQKLEEAQARMKNAQAAVAEARAIQEGILVSINQKISKRQEVLRSLVPPGADEGQIPDTMREQYEGQSAALADLMQRQQEALEPLRELQEHADTTADNVNRLTEALQNAVGGFVNLGGGEVDPIHPGERDEEKSGGGSAPKGRDASMLDELLGITDEAQERTQERMTSALERQRQFQENAMAMLNEARDQGLITQEQYQKAEQMLAADHNAKMRALNQQRVQDTLSASSEMFQQLAAVTSSGGEKIMRISQGLAAAQALISTYQGAAKELEKGTFGFATAAAVIAKGLGFVAAIRGASSSSAGGAPSVAVGGGAAGGTAGSIPERERERDRFININLGGSQFLPTEAVYGLIDQINDAVGEGHTIRGVR